MTASKLTLLSVPQIVDGAFEEGGNLAESYCRMIVLYGGGAWLYVEECGNMTLWWRPAVIWRRSNDLSGHYVCLRRENLFSFGISFNSKTNI